MESYTYLTIARARNHSALNLYIKSSLIIPPSIIPRWSCSAKVNEKSIRSVHQESSPRKFIEKATNSYQASLALDKLVLSNSIKVLVQSKLKLLLTITAMDIALSCLPPEIAVNILRWLPAKDNKNVRLVSKFFNVIASQFVFESLYISTKLKDREAFTAVSEHPFLSQLVKEVVFDSTNIMCEDRGERFDLNRPSYISFLASRLLAVSSTSSSSVVYCSRGSLNRGYDSFLKGFHEQSRLAKYDGDDLTRNSDILSRPADFSSLLMDPKNHSDLARYLPDDLVCLVHGLPRMPRVRRFKITDRRYSNTAKYRKQKYSCFNNNITRLSVSVNHLGIRGTDEAILNPRPWPSIDEQGGALDRSWYRGFFVLAQAASMTNMRTLESFKVERDCIKSGLSHTVFNMSQRELFHTTNVFSNLTIIELKIQTACCTGKSWDDTIARGDLARVLGAAKHLEILDLRMDVVNSNPVDFATLLGTHTWPNLHKFTLAAVMLKFEGNGFLEFFNRHRYTLRSLWLEEVMIVTPEQAGRVRLDMLTSDIFSIREKEFSNRWSSWTEILSAMALDPVALTYITFFQNNFGPKRTGWVYHSCNAATAFDFLRSGGMNRPTVPCQHRARSFWFEEDR